MTKKDDSPVVGRVQSMKVQDSAVVDAGRLDVLFAALFLTSFGALVLGNLLMLKKDVLTSSVAMWVPCLGLLLVVYALSRMMGGTLQGMVATLGLVFVLVRLRAPWTAPLFYLLTLGAAVYAVPRFRPRGIPWWGVLLMAGLAVVVSFSPYALYHSFDNLNAARSGLVQKDALYHSAIAAMIKNYGIASTGLHGLVRIPYYVLSHHLVALLSLASGRGVFEVYGVVTHVLLIPLLIFSGTCAADRLFVGSRIRMEVAWTMGALLLVVPIRFLHEWGVHPQVLVSESSLLSSSVFVLSVPLLLKRSVNTGKDIVWAVAAAGILAFTKAPTAIIYAGLWTARCLFVDRLRSKAILVIAGLSLVLLWYYLFIYMSTSLRGVAVNWLGLFHHVRLVRGPGSPIDLALVEWRKFGSVQDRALYEAILEAGAFLFFHFFLSWLVLAGMVWRRGAGVLWRAPVAVCMWAGILGGAAFVFFFKSNHGNAYYFSYPAFLAALPVCAGWVGLRSRRKSAGAVAAVLLAAIVWTCLLHDRSFVKYSRLSPLHAVRFESPLVEALLQARKEVPLDTVLRAPPRVWELDPVRWGGQAWRPVQVPGEGSWPSAGPFLFPAISERAWVDVIPPASLLDPQVVRFFDRDPYTSYFYSLYKIDRVNGGVKSDPALMPGMKVEEWAQGPRLMAEKESRQ